LPAWLINKPGLVTRTWNAPFQAAMARWVHELVRRIGDRQATRGGPVILVQMENEYANIARRYGAAGQRYLTWCAALAREAGVEVPLIMCEGAPAGLLETLNGFSVWRRVDRLFKERPNQPALWTENWTGWYDIWGQPHNLRRATEIAYEILRFVAHGGTGINYYMWHGGTNFDRTAMFLATTSYDFDSPLDEFGLPTDKSRHLAQLHRALQHIAPVLLAGRRLQPKVIVPGELPQQADGVLLHAYRLHGRTVILLINGNDWPKRVKAGGVELELPTRSGVIIERGRVTYRTWDKPAAPIRRVMEPVALRFCWRTIPESLPARKSYRPVWLPHNMAGGESDFGWYRTTVQAPRATTARLSAPVSDFLAAWVNGRYVGVTPSRFKENRQRADFVQTLEIPLRCGANELVLLVTALGLIKGDWMIQAPQSEEAKGLLGPVKLAGGRLTGDWEFVAGLQGPGQSADMPLRWYRTHFTLSRAALAKPEPWAVAVGELSRGRLWINGHGLGRYWQAPTCAAVEADIACHPHLLIERSEQPNQRWYHIPPDWLRPGTNELAVLEEAGGQPTGVQLLRRR